MFFFFLGECGLAFSGSPHWIWDPNNGNFLGLIELLSRWHPILQEHVQWVREHQKMVNAFKFITYLQSYRMSLSQNVLTLWSNIFCWKEGLQNYSQLLWMQLQTPPTLSRQHFCWGMLIYRMVGMKYKKDFLCSQIAAINVGKSCSVNHIHLRRAHHSSEWLQGASVWKCC